MAIKVLADGNKKLSILTEKPAAWETTGIPLLTELAAGIDASCLLLLENFQFGAADSDKVSEPALCTDNNANSLGRKNGQAGFSFWRWFDDDGGFDDTADVVFAATKVPGTTLYLFGRQMDKKATTAWAASDEIYYAAEVITDRLQPVDEAGGFIKYRAPLEVQRDYQWLTVPAGGG